jgi:hypothetical protein
MHALPIFKSLNKMRFWVGLSLNSLNEMRFWVGLSLNMPQSTQKRMHALLF